MTEERWDEITEIIESGKYKIDSNEHAERDYDNSPYMRKPYIEGSILITFDKKDYDLKELKEYIESGPVVITDIMKDYVSIGDGEFYDVVINYNTDNIILEQPYIMGV